MVGARRARTGYSRGWSGQYRSQCCAAHARRRAARQRNGPSVVRLWIPAGARGGDAAGRAARRPHWPEDGLAWLLVALRCWLGGLRLRADGGRVHCRAICAGTRRRGIVVMNLSALTVLFSEEERPRAVGVLAAANFLALPIGPILGGWLLTHYWWGWVFLMNVPVSLIGLIASLALVPKSRAPEPPGLDPFGVVASTAGLVGVTYGLIQAGRSGWGDASALVPIIAGVALLLGFFLWEYVLGKRPGGQPLIDLGLFRSTAFTWGVILAATAGLAMIGVLFTLPQYFQGILGTDAMGSGVRLLPLIGGLIVGAVPADRVVHLIGAKITGALGFALLAAGMLIGSTTGLGSSDGFIAVWVALAGLGLGLTFATSAAAAVSELSSERSGVGAAVMQAFQKIGGPLGTAILGSVLSSVYLSQLHLTGLPAAVATAVRESLFGGIAVADRLHSPALLSMVRGAFVNGMDVSLVVAAGIAAAGVLLTLAFLPSHTAIPRAGGVEAVAVAAPHPVAVDTSAPAERGEREHDGVAQG